MKKIFICALSLLTAALFFVSCTEDSTLYCETTKPQFNSLSDPKAIAFFHNATIEAYLETITRSDDISPNDDVKLICQIVSGLLLQYGFQISPTDEDIEIITEYSRDFSARIKDSVLDALTYYINILPFDSETKTELLRLSILDIQNGTNMALEYMNKQNALKTRSIHYSNEWETFCAVGNASALFWKSLETRGRIDSRGWFGTFADAAGSLICAGCGVLPGIVVSAIFSLNANYGEPNFDDCMDTNCD
ncbi:MAG: hypothetical protein PUI54_00875 [Bacteroidales bacterium]|nr:hypothetical protein [Bacteroidales bacterium]MDY2936150.1 hypothetical protein [Candidatus Cryptobacteroides sp.]